MEKKKYKNLHFSPEYVRCNPIILKIYSVDALDGKKEFEPLTHEELVRGSIKLTQTLCSEPYFIWGGFNASRLTFECVSEKFVNKAPHGKIKLTITPTVYVGDELATVLTDEETALFTGYIETAEPEIGDGHWTVTAYDRLYRVRNNNVWDFIQQRLEAASAQGTHLTWYNVERLIASSQLLLGEKDTLPEWTKSIYYPDNSNVNAENGVDLLRDFALCTRRFGILDGEENLEYIEVQDSNTGSECYVVDDFAVSDLNISSGHTWLPKFFTSEPRTNVFYTEGDTTQDEDYYNNIYVISNNPIIGNQDWINTLYECDEYGAPSTKYNVSALPAGLFDTSQMCLTDGEEYYCQEYKITVLADPTIPMGSILHIVKGGQTIVRSYIMERTIKFSSTQVIECEMSAQNEAYNAVVPTSDKSARNANILANEASANMPFISDGSSLTKLRACKVISKTEYSKLTEKREDTIYYVYDDTDSAGGENS